MQRVVPLPQVMAAQANFVRVKVDAIEGSDGAAAAQPPPRTRLLCVVRGLLKKIKQSVLVGDQVRVVGIDWTDGRGEAAGRAALPGALRCSRTVPHKLGSPVACAHSHLPTAYA